MQLQSSCAHLSSLEGQSVRQGLEGKVWAGKQQGQPPGVYPALELSDTPDCSWRPAQKACSQQGELCPGRVELAYVPGK